MQNILGPNKNQVISISSPDLNSNLFSLFPFIILLIIIALSTNTPWISINFAIFNGDVDNNLLTTDPCSVLITGFNGGNNSIYGHTLYGVYLSQNSVYSLIISGGTPTSYGNFGAQVLFFNLI